MHGVPPNKTNRIRKALGVNALTKNTLGDKETISEIIFGRFFEAFNTTERDPVAITFKLSSILVICVG